MCFTNSVLWRLATHTFCQAPFEYLLGSDREIRVNDATNATSTRFSVFPEPEACASGFRLRAALENSSPNLVYTFR